MTIEPTAAAASGPSPVAWNTMRTRGGSRRSLGKIAKAKRVSMLTHRNPSTVHLRGLELQKRKRNPTVGSMLLRWIKP
jgi:hypothetical protein